MQSRIFFPGKYKRVHTSLDTIIKFCQVWLHEEGPGLQNIGIKNECQHCQLVLLEITSPPLGQLTH